MENIVGPKTLSTDEILNVRGIKRDKYDTYNHNGIPVPRVSHILDACFDKQGLIKWAGSLAPGESDNVKKEAVTIGSFAHEFIENFLLEGADPDFMQIHVHSYREAVRSCYYNFLRWHSDNLNAGLKFEVVDIEHTVTCPWYGGTIDCIANLTFPDGFNENIIVDFKTSKSIGIEYIMQTYAYLWAMNYNRFFDPTSRHIDGILIIRVDKTTEKYEQAFLDYRLTPSIMQELEYNLGSLINWYYSQINMRTVLYDAKRVDMFSKGE